MPEGVVAPRPPVEAPVVATPARPLVARGMTGSVRFDGALLTVTREDAFDPLVAGLVTAQVPLAQLRGLRRWPATTTHRGYLLLDLLDGPPPPSSTFELPGGHPVDDRPWIAYKLRQEADVARLQRSVLAALARRTGAGAPS